MQTEALEDQLLSGQRTQDLALKEKELELQLARERLQAEQEEQHILTIEERLARQFELERQCKDAEFNLAQARRESEILHNEDCQSTGAEPLPVSVPNHRTALTINACPPVQIPSALAPADPPKSIALPTPIAHASPAATPKSAAANAGLKMPVSVHDQKIAAGDTPPPATARHHSIPGLSCVAPIFLLFLMPLSALPA